MNTKTNILSNNLLRAVMMIIVMAWANGVWGQNTKERLLYSTNFTEWENIDRRTADNKEVHYTTDYSKEDLTFTLNGVGVSPTITQDKFIDSIGFMITAKYPEEYQKVKPNAVTSKLANITKIIVSQSATGGNRGLKLSVKGDGDSDWVTLLDRAKNKDYDISTLNVNRTNCQIKLENTEVPDPSKKPLNQNIYISYLAIFGQVDATIEEPVKYKAKFTKPTTIDGNVPNTVVTDKEGKVTIPEAPYLYRKGWTLDCWTDGENDYYTGKEYTLNKDVTLTPKIFQNTSDITDTEKDIDVVWSFDHTTSPAIRLPMAVTSARENFYRSKVYVKPVQISLDNANPVKQDLLMTINVPEKCGDNAIDNTDPHVNCLNDGTEGAQIKDGVEFVIPAVYGMKVTVNASDKVDYTKENLEVSTHFGTGETDAQIVVEDGEYTVPNEDIIIEDDKTISFTYKGKATQVTIRVVKAGTAENRGFYKDITVTYPVLPSIVFTNVISNSTAEDKQKFPNEDVANAGEVTVQKTIQHSNTGKRYIVGDKVTICATPKYGYSLKAFEENNKELERDNNQSSIIYTIKEGKNQINVLYERQTLHKVIAKIDNRLPGEDKENSTALGKVSLSPIYTNFYNEITETNAQGAELTQIECWYIEGDIVMATAEAGTDLVVNYWTEENSDEHKSNAGTYTFKVETAKTIIAHFALGASGTVVFDIGSAVRVNGDISASVHYATEKYNGSTSVNPTTLSNVRSFTIPTNYTIFRDLDDDEKSTNNYSTLRYWIEKSDSGKVDQNHYEPGEQYSFRYEGEKLTLIPVFEMNPASQQHRLNDPVIRYDFGRKVKEYYDPTTKERRKVCAQSVDIDHKQKVFWTSKVWVNVLENATQYPHTRDVALWCDTGKKGYIRNTELDNWAAFGPGTKFWFPSCVGTKVSILTYSKIKTTKIDNAVPTLDEERTAEERAKQGTDKLYVYSYTTNNPADRACIEIGDDYSYYQWFEIASKAANKVNLHTSLEIEGRGKITDVKSSASTEYQAEELEDGGYAFHQGDRAIMQIRRKFGYQLDKVVDIDKQDSDGNPLAVLKMNYDKDNTIDMIDFDGVTIQKSIKPTTTVEGTTWGEKDKDVFVLKQTEPTTEMATDSLRTTYDLEFSITTHRRLMVCFKEKDTYYITYNGGQYATGTAPSAVLVEAGDKFTIPQNTTLYYEGNTLDHWVDDDYETAKTEEEKAAHTYSIGSAYQAPAKDVRMFPVFLPNSFNILELENDAKITWHFTRKDGAPIIAYERTDGILVSQLHDGKGKYIDLKLNLLATAQGKDDKLYGKFNNENNTNRMQINRYSVIEFPATAKCVAEIVATDNDVQGTEFKGKSDTKKQGDTGYTAEGNSIKVVCEGDTAYYRATFTKSTYGVDFAVTYKTQTAKKPELFTLKCGNEEYDQDKIKELMNKDNCITFHVSPWESDDKEIPTITGTATENGTVTATQATLSGKEAVVTVRNEQMVIVMTYPVKFVFNVPDDAPTLSGITVNKQQKLVGDDGEIEFDDVPQSGTIKFSFNRTMSATTIHGDGINTPASSARVLSFSFWDLPQGKTTTYEIPANTFVDIYGKQYETKLTVKLHVTQQQGDNQHKTFDFIVGKDGNMDEAITAANNKTGNERFYIFVPDGEYQLTGNYPVPNLGNKNNGVTRIAKSNISLIGQSKDGVTIWNKPTTGGLQYTSTIFIDRNLTDFYAQDLTLENRFDYWNASKDAQAPAFWDRGSRSVLKNVAIRGWQDTYYSNNGNDDSRGYFENCDIAGVVDFLCGDGNIWFQKCNILIRERSGNNIAAPSTHAGQDWGYVFYDCVIKPDVENSTVVKNYDYTLARPWNDLPTCAFINTQMQVLPRQTGWGRMGGEEKRIRFHEYGSRDKAGNSIPLATRTLAACVPAAGSDECVLNAAQAEKYTLHNVVGGDDGFEPDRLCTQIDAASNEQDEVEEKDADGLEAEKPNRVIWTDNIELEDEALVWDACETALCYFVFKRDENGNWIYQTNTTASNVNLTSFGSGYYCVRAANQRGGLGKPTKTVLYIITDPYELEIKQVGKTEGYGWTTICLPFNAKVPDEVTAYALIGTAEGATQISGYDAILSPVKEVINSEKGYVVYGPVGKYIFKATSRTDTQTTLLTGNPTNTAISASNTPCYVLSNKQWGLGFYKYAGATLAAYRAWLPQEVVKNSIQQGLAAGTRGLRIVVKDNSTGVLSPLSDFMPATEVLYNLSGQRVESAAKRGVYISRKRGKFLKQ